MIIGSRQILEALSESPVITIGDDDIKRVKDKTVLGIKLDDQLKWNKHNDEQCERISKSTFCQIRCIMRGSHSPGYGSRWRSDSATTRKVKKSDYNPQ